MTPPKLPAFESLLKSREVEDPVNLWVHRPLAYGLVALLYRSPVTPNQITLLATLAGLASGACFILGERSLMVWGGALLWASSILDGADGILARAQNRFTALGRALDGTADAVVAIATVLPAFYHLYAIGYSRTLLLWSPVAIGLAVLHIELYDYYKESFLQMTNPSWDGRPERLAEVESRLRKAQAAGASFIEILANHVYVNLVRAQTKLVARTNPEGSREPYRFTVSPESVAIYRRYNRGPMKLWSAISLAPHSYSMAICAMFDRLDIYFWLRLVFCNVLFAIVLLWQRRASRLTLQALAAQGMAPVLADAA